MSSSSLARLSGSPSVAGVSSPLVSKPRSSCRCAVSSSCSLVHQTRFQPPSAICWAVVSVIGGPAQYATIGVPIFQVLAGALSAADELAFVKRSSASAPVRRCLFMVNQRQESEIDSPQLAAWSSRLFALVLDGICRGRTVAMYRMLIIALAFAACSRSTPRPVQLELLATIGAGLGGEFAGGDAGPPCAVAADEHAVFLGWRAARAGHEIVACDPGGRTPVSYTHGPQLSGVRSLAADGGMVFVLADADGTKLYRLDAATGALLPWEGRAENDLAITSLWGDDKTKINRADWLAADNGRLYVTFGAEGFVAVLDAKT